MLGGGLPEVSGLFEEILDLSLIFYMSISQWNRTSVAHSIYFRVKKYISTRAFVNPISFTPEFRTEKMVSLN